MTTGGETISVALFKSFQPRFSEITWHTNRLVTEWPCWSVANDMIFQGEKLLLAPGYLGQDGPIPFVVHTSQGTFHQFWWSNYGEGSNYTKGRKDNRPSFHVREGNLAFHFVFDPSQEEAVGRQLERAVMRAVYEGPFKGRRFFMRPKLEIQDRRFCRLSIIPVEFYTNGRPIAGLHLGEAMAYDWKFFIPDGPERAAIQAAVDLEYAQDVQERHRNEYPELGAIPQLRARLDECLSAITPVPC